MTTKSALFISILSFLLIPLLVQGAESQITVAVAANFSRALNEVSEKFQKDTGIEVRYSVASTGKLYALINNGAPFDIFLAADTKRPEMLFKKGLATKPVVYAKGHAVLWASKENLCKMKNWRHAISSATVTKVAIPSPKLAPYGAVVAPLLENGDLPKIPLVYGNNVNLAFQFSENITGIGFTALSLALSEPGLKGCYWLMPETEAVQQGACVLKRTKKRAETEAFLAYLLSDKTTKLLTKYGYGG